MRHQTERSKKSRTNKRLNKWIPLTSFCCLMTEEAANLTSSCTIGCVLSRSLADSLLSESECQLCKRIETNTYFTICMICPRSSSISFCVEKKTSNFLILLRTICTYTYVYLNILSSLFEVFGLNNITPLPLVYYKIT